MTSNEQNENNVYADLNVSYTSNGYLSIPFNTQRRKKVNNSKLGNARK